MIFGTCPHLSVGTSFSFQLSPYLQNDSCCLVTCKGTFAIISLMTAQAISGVPLDLSNSTQNGTTMATNVTETDLLAAKVGISTTLAFFVGIIQV